MDEDELMPMDVNTDSVLLGEEEGRSLESDELETMLVCDKSTAENDTSEGPAAKEGRGDDSGEDEAMHEEVVSRMLNSDDDKEKERTATRLRFRSERTESGGCNGVAAAARQLRTSGKDRQLPKSPNELKAQYGRYKNKPYSEPSAACPDSPGGQRGAREQGRGRQAGWQPLERQNFFPAGQDFWPRRHFKIPYKAQNCSRRTNAENPRWGPPAWHPYSRHGSCAGASSDARWQEPDWTLPLQLDLEQAIQNGPLWANQWSPAVPAAQVYPPSPNSDLSLPAFDNHTLPPGPGKLQAPPPTGCSKTTAVALQPDGSCADERPSGRYLTGPQPTPPPSSIHTSPPLPPLFPPVLLPPPPQSTFAKDEWSQNIAPIVPLVIQDGDAARASPSTHAATVKQDNSGSIIDGQSSAPVTDASAQSLQNANFTAILAHNSWMSDWAHHNPAGPAVVQATLSGCGHQGRTAGQVPVTQAGTFLVPVWATATTAVPASPTLSGPSVRVATLEEPDLADSGRRGSSQAADAAVNRAATARPDARGFLLAAHRQLCFPGRVEQSLRAATGAEHSLPAPRNLATVAGTVVVPTAGRRNSSVLQQQAPVEPPGGSRGTLFARAGSARAASATPLLPVTYVPGEAQCTVGTPGGNLQGVASESPALCRWNARAQRSAASGDAKLQNDDSAAETHSTHWDAAAVQVSTAYLSALRRQKLDRELVLRIKEMRRRERAQLSLASLPCPLPAACQNSGATCATAEKLLCWARRPWLMPCALSAPAGWDSRSGVAGDEAPQREQCGFPLGRLREENEDEFEVGGGDNCDNVPGQRERRVVALNQHSPMFVQTWQQRLVIMTPVTQPGSEFQDVHGVGQLAGAPRLPLSHLQSLHVTIDNNLACHGVAIGDGEQSSQMENRFLQPSGFL